MVKMQFNYNLYDSYAIRHAHFSLFVNEVTVKNFNE